MKACSQEKIFSYLLGEFSGEELEAFQKHVSGCPECAQLLATYETTDRLLKTREPVPVPKALGKACIQTVTQLTCEEREASPLRRLFEGVYRQPFPAWRVAAVAAVFLLGLGLGKIVFDRPTWTEKYGRFARANGVSDQIDDGRALRNYLLSVETLFLDLSNMEIAAFLDEEEWEAELELTREVLRRTRELSRIMEGRNPELFQLMTEIEWVLEEIVGTEGWELAELSKDFQRSIGERRLLMKIHGYIS